MESTFTLDRRKYQRISLNTSITYQIKGNREVNYTLSKDISEGGMGIILDKFLPKNRELILQFNLKRTSTPMRIRAKLVWINKLPYTEGYRAGLEFQEMEPLQRTNIKRFINKEPLLLYY